MTPYDGTYKDIANRLRDDEMVSLKLLDLAADMIERYGAALEEIEKFGHNHGHGRGYTCATIAGKALIG